MECQNILISPMFIGLNANFQEVVEAGDKAF